MTNTTKLEMAIARSGLTKRFLAEKLGLSNMGLYKKINNFTEFKASEIEILSELLKLTPYERDAIFFASDVDFKSTYTIV